MPALPTASISDQATYLKTGFSSWFGDNPSSFNLATTGTGAQNVARELIYDYDGFIGVTGAGTDADGLSAARRVLVDRALRDIGSKFNITFRQAVAADPVGNVDLFFKDNEGGAFANSQLFGSGNAAFAANHRYTDFTWINISTSWNGGSNADNDYTYQTFYHEILHGLGLGHAGAYNGGASYITDSAFATSNNNVYINDSWEMSIMSYFDQWENTTVPGNTSSDLITMMAADVEALRTYYGSGRAFTGNTIYGVGTNILASTSYMLANLSSFANSNAFCIVDDGGIDTVNFSNFSDNQRLDLTVRAAGDTSDFGNTTSDIGGRIRNMTLAAGTIIENAVLGGGNDSITGNSANNLLTGGGGNDSIYGFDGNDTLNGDAGNDNLNGGNGNDTLNGGNDNDTLNGGAGNDRLNGGSGNDSLVGGAGIDTLNGGDGNDTIISDGDTGIYNGDAGDDLMFSGFGQETINGGTGIDTINHTSFGGDYTFNMATGLTGFGGEIFSSFENAVMGGGNDNVTGNASNNIIYGGAGNDILAGMAGLDTLDGGDGNDSLNGGSGNDSLLGGAGIDTLNGGDGNDTISSDGDAGIYNGDAGDDVMFSGLGSETMNGGTGTDTINHTAFSGNYTFNLATGLTNFAGESFSNFENAVMGGGNDNITGNASNNIIQAGAGNDTLNGGAGSDRLTGAGGSDIFIFQFGESIAAAFDTIAAADGIGGDYQIGIDRIDLLTAGGGVMATPGSFWRAGNSAAASVSDLLTAVFADANGALAGNQILGVNAAAFVVASTAAIAGNYVIVNDGVAGFQAATDLVFKVNVLSGSLPVLGVNSASSWFV